MPSSDEVANISTAEASSEVSQQNAAWRAAGGGEDAGRLKLVTPPEGDAEAAAAPEASGRVESQIGSLESDIAEQKRLLELRNQELADLQKKLADSRAKEPEAAQPAPVPETAGRAERRDCRCAGGRYFNPAAPLPAEAKPKPARAKPAPAADSGESFLDTLTDNWTILVGAAVLLLLGMLGFNFVRRRRDEDVDGALRDSTCRLPRRYRRKRCACGPSRRATRPRK